MYAHTSLSWLSLNSMSSITPLLLQVLHADTSVSRFCLRLIVRRSGNKYKEDEGRGEEVGRKKKKGTECMQNGVACAAKWWLQSPIHTVSHSVAHAACCCSHR